MKNLRGLEVASSSMTRHQLEEYKAIAATGHGWVLPRPDGSQANCGGPRLCRECALERAVFSSRERVVVMEGMVLKPGDQILLLAPPTADPRDIEDMSAKLKRDFPDIGFTVMYGFAGVQVHRQDPSV